MLNSKRAALPVIISCTPLIVVIHHEKAKPPLAAYIYLLCYLLHALRRFWTVGRSRSRQFWSQSMSAYIEWNDRRDIFLPRACSYIVDGVGTKRTTEGRLTGGPE